MRSLAIVLAGSAAVAMAGCGQGGDYEAVDGKPVETELGVPLRVQAEPTAAAGAGLRRISEGGYDYGDCGGLQLAVLLTPEPCAEASEVLIERAAARLRQP